MGTVLYNPSCGILEYSDRSSVEWIHLWTLAGFVIILGSCDMFVGWGCWPKLAMARKAPCFHLVHVWVAREEGHAILKIMALRGWWSFLSRLLYFPRLKLSGRSNNVIHRSLNASMMWITTRGSPDSNSDKTTTVDPTKEHTKDQFIRRWICFMGRSQNNCMNLYKKIEFFLYQRALRSPSSSCDTLCHCCISC